MGGKTTLSVVLAVLITALLVGTLTYFARSQRLTALQQQMTALEQTNAQLENQNEALREEVKALQQQLANGTGEDGQDGGTGIVISRFPRPGWEAYFPDAETTTLQGEPVDKVRNLLGEPPYLIRSIAASPDFNREIWIYQAGEEDPTGLYLFFKANRLVQSRLDEFNGLYGSGLLEYPGFWLE